MAFSFMETSFVISLGITFVLLLLLIYHFKQRLTVTESKQDTMFEIINNLAQELSNIKMSLSLMNRPSTPYPHNVSNEPVSNENVKIYEQMVDLVNEDEDSDYEDSDDEYSTDEDSDDENDKIIVSEEEDNISVEEIRPTEDVDNSEELVIDILENIQTNTQGPKSLDSEQPQEVEIEEEIEKPDFSKMNLGTLKTYIIEQGWVEDASKMKKAQILSLIQEHQ